MQSYFLNIIGKPHILINNSVTFCGKPIGSEEFLKWMVETLGITVDRRPKERLRKRAFIKL